MLISELIAELARVLAEEGDLEVRATGCGWGGEPTEGDPGLDVRDEERHHDGTVWVPRRLVIGEG